jgi:hypothetical protein
MSAVDSVAASASASSALAPAGKRRVAYFYDCA